MVVTEAAFAGTWSVGYDVDGLRDSLSVHGRIRVNPHPRHFAQAAIECVSDALILLSRTSTEDSSVVPWSEVPRLIVGSLLDASSSKKSEVSVPVIAGPKKRPFSGKVDESKLVR